MWTERLGVTWTDVWTGVVAGVGIYLCVILLTRLFTQRSLTTMSSFDFPVTVAIGAVVGRTALVHTSLAGGAIALLTLFSAQAAVGFVRNRTGLSRVLESRSRVLVVDGELVERHFRKAHLSREDVFEKLRLAGVSRIADVRLMVHERGGGISVITGPEPIDGALLGDVLPPGALRQKLSQRRGEPHGEPTRASAAGPAGTRRGGQ